MTTFEVKKWNQRISVVSFNNGYSHIIVDDNCWLIANGDKTSPWIFQEAMEVLKQLPDSPSDYAPYTEYLSGAA